MSQPGFFTFRWQPEQPASTVAEHISVVFKVPGAVDLSVLPDLIESVCLGPVVPSAVVILQMAGDNIIPALREQSVKNALSRFTGRMPMVVLTVAPAPYSITLAESFEASEAQTRDLITCFATKMDWLQCGLTSIFRPDVVVVSAPAGYAFRKPSTDRSTYFIRAELALSTSAAVSFVAFGVLLRLVRDYGKVPEKLRLLLVDTMNVAATAFALRELLSFAGAKVIPQIESFHSYGGIEEVSSPLPGTSLCIVSASSTMNLHRKWTRTKSLSNRDAVTLVTFEDAEGSEHALCRLPASARPEAAKPSAAYDIQITGEYFFPAIEPMRKILLTTTHHSCKDLTENFRTQCGKNLFGAFRGVQPSGPRRSLFVDGNLLLETKEFQSWVDKQIPQMLKVGTAHIIFQDDGPSARLAQHIGAYALHLGCPHITVLNAKHVSGRTVKRHAPIVCVAAVVGGGNAMLSLSRDLRNCHEGARLYLIGTQVAESSAKVETFNRNLRHSSHDAAIEIMRWGKFLSTDAVRRSFLDELELYKNSDSMRERKQLLQSGLDARSLFFPSGPSLSDPLVLNVDFSFWKKGYEPAPYHAEVLGTIATVLQNARTSNLSSSEYQLRSPLLMQVVLDPENFARFNEGVIQAALLRAALPSELDFRGDSSTSEYMANFLARIASKFDEPQVATLEFILAMVTRKLQLNAEHTTLVRSKFSEAIRERSDPLSLAIRFFLDVEARSQHSDRRAF